MSTYAIGDVHGCYRELNQLLETIQYQDGDCLWFVGDLVNRGPESLAVLRLVRDLPNKIMVLGNHDIYLLALHYGMDYPRVSDSMKTILSAPDVEELCAWLAQQPLLHHDASLNAVMVHAGIWPLWDLATAKRMARVCEEALHSNQDAAFWTNLFGNTPALYEGATGIDALRFMLNAFTRMRYCKPNGAIDLEETASPSECQQNDLCPWYAWPQRQPIQETMVFGHWSSLNGKCPVETIHALDTGCVWGGALTALRLDDGQRFSVPHRAG